MEKSGRNGRSLQYEPLEAREMMAVTGSLNNGVLKITGSKYADQVNFEQNSGSIIDHRVAALVGCPGQFDRDRSQKGQRLPVA